MTGLVLSVLYFLLALYGIRKLRFFQDEHLSPLWFNFLFIMKIAAAIVLYLVYNRIYPERAYADIFRYYDDSAILFSALEDQPIHFLKMISGFGAGDPQLEFYYSQMRNWYNRDGFFNDTRTMIRIAAFLRLFSLNTYFPQVVIFSFLSFCGLTALWKYFNSLVGGRKLWHSFLVFLLPSVLLWTSGMVKEAVLIFALGSLLWLTTRLHTDTRLILIWMLLGFIMLLMKAYVLFALLPLLLAVWIFRNFGRSWAIMTYLATFFLAILVFEILSEESLPQVFAHQQNEFILHAQAESAGSLVKIPLLDGTWTSIFRSAPEAWMRALLRPYPGEASHLLMQFSAAENILMLLIIILSLSRLKPGVHDRFTTFRLVLWFVFASGLLILVAELTPVLGALVRYKVPALPFLIFSVSGFSTIKMFDDSFLKTTSIFKLLYR